MEIEIEIEIEKEKEGSCEHHFESLYKAKDLTWGIIVFVIPIHKKTLSLTTVVGFFKFVKISTYLCIHATVRAYT